MIFAIFEDLVRQGKTILMVTHDHALASRMSRVIELEDGQIRNEPQPIKEIQPLMFAGKRGWKGWLKAANG
jgi:ABC-type lipoprotein export system ATPase subunit